MLQLSKALEAKLSDETNKRKLAHKWSWYRWGILFPILLVIACMSFLDTFQSARDTLPAMVPRVIGRA